MIDIAAGSRCYQPKFPIRIVHYENFHFCVADANCECRRAHCRTMDIWWGNTVRINTMSCRTTAYGSVFGLAIFTQEVFCWLCRGDKKATHH